MTSRPLARFGLGPQISAMLIRAGVVVVLGLGIWAVSSGEGSPEPEPVVILMQPEVSWSPTRPGEGSLFRIRVQASEHTPLIGAHGVVAGEELHFERIDERVFESIAAVPVGAGAEIDAEMRFVYAEGPEGREELTIPVEAGSYPHEQLRVAPRFGAPPSEEDQARLARDRDLAAAASAAAHRTPRLWTDEVILPRDSRVTSEFGGGRVFNGQVSSRHMGLDLRGAPGDTVLATARGVVALVEPFLLAGNVVYLNHGAGLLSAYFHLSEQLVAPGDTVEAGDPVGRVGSTGRVTGPHLHWVVRYGRTSVDPRSLLELGSPPSP
ncbi:MAG: M23 family metallopeptidase [Gemmatimonadota bacterium]